ncbi:hypothetical protein Q31a_20370 [Aureliella helgolandensis]|uniref:Uncharacterized protein n=1 Tax=Aureliella helgolandensis TaxID=2527968 RepID=A0A518G568_9BACT|nr:hypothetical protein Q31a_20370 [Aureliella helgolandensis]
MQGSRAEPWSSRWRQLINCCSGSAVAPASDSSLGTGGLSLRCAAAHLPKTQRPANCGERASGESVSAQQRTENKHNGWSSVETSRYRPVDALLGERIEEQCRLGGLRRSRREAAADQALERGLLGRHRTRSRCRSTVATVVKKWWWIPARPMVEA